MTLHVHFVIPADKLDNDDIVDGQGYAVAAAFDRASRETGEIVRSPGGGTLPLRDINGNTIGQWGFSVHEPTPNPEAGIEMTLALPDGGFNEETAEQVTRLFREQATTVSEIGWLFSMKPMTVTDEQGRTLGKLTSIFDRESELGTSEEAFMARGAHLKTLIDSWVHRGGSVNPPEEASAFFMTLADAMDDALEEDGDLPGEWEYHEWGNIEFSSRNELLGFLDEVDKAGLSSDISNVMETYREKTDDDMTPSADNGNNAGPNAG